MEFCAVNLENKKVFQMADFHQQHMIKTLPNSSETTTNDATANCYNDVPFQNGNSSGDERETCALFKGNHTITVTKTDENGHKCNGIIAIAVCGGMCSSSEKGTHFFPHKENENSFCVPIETTPIRHELINCDKEALPTIRWIEFNETKQCGCKSIDPPTN